MATPKKRTGKAKQNARRANWKGSTPATTTCPNCKAIVLTHTVCPECGYYKNGIASKKGETATEVKAQAPVEAKEEKTEEVKKTRKPRAKKAEVAAEEVKEEAVVEAEEKTEE